MIINSYLKHNNLLVFTVFVLCIFFINLTYEYSKYQELIDEEVFETKVEVLNIYNKKSFYVLKLKNKDFNFFTNFENIDEITQKDNLNIAFLTNRINFIDYLRGFYTKTIYFEILQKEENLSLKLANISASHHQNEMI